jgi:ketosteroid isomerase-like protein
MGSAENARLARELNDAFEHGDMATMDRLIADDVIWHQIGGPDVVGKDALRRMPQPGMGADYELSGTARDVLGGEEHAVILTNAVAKRAGRTLEYQTAEIHRIRNGQVVERWAYSDDTARVAEFFK